MRTTVLLDGFPINAGADQDIDCSMMRGLDLLVYNGGAGASTYVVSPLLSGNFGSFLYANAVNVAAFAFNWMRFSTIGEPASSNAALPAVGAFSAALFLPPALRIHNNGGATLLIYAYARYDE